METIERNPEKILLSDAAESFNNKDYIRAKKCIIQLLNINPGKGEYFSGLGIINKKIGRLKEAEENFLSAINKNPSLYEAYYNLGILYHENKIYESAVKYYTASLKINPNLHLAYYNLGNLYRELDQFSKASEFYKMAAAIKLDYPDAYYNLGVISEKLYDFNSALQYYKKTLLVDPGHVEAHWNKSLMHLLLGDFENGWKDYEWRVKRKEADTRYFPGPYLIDQDINGKTIFVYSEQGLGDVIQFSRYLPLLKKAGANIIFECNSSLYDLFKRVNYIDILFKEGNDNFQVEYDYQISVLSLPFFFKTKLNTIPDKIPYLFSDAALSEELKPVMRREKKINAGIVWAGNPKNVNDVNRSCSLKDFSTLFSSRNLSFFSLQFSEAAGQLKDSDFPVIDLGADRLDTFLKTASVIENLDLVITVDTSIAHLAGAMGKSVWTLLPYFPDWRWMLSRDDSPWYPSMKLFRQPEPKNWEAVFKKVLKELQVLTKK